MNIKLLKLKCGDLVIAKISEGSPEREFTSGGKNLILEDPMLLDMRSIQPWIIGDVQVNPIYTIPSDFVLLICTPHQDLLLKYQEVLTGVKV